MTRHLDLPGQSGTTYRYKTLDDLRPVPPGGANFVYVKWDKDTPVIVYAGETDSLHRSVFETWDDAQKGFGATEIFGKPDDLLKVLIDIDLIGADHANSDDRTLPLVVFPDFSNRDIKRRTKSVF